jgi:GNAT superfamily N-acetyltransferase
MTFIFHPVTPERWPDLERLFAASKATASGEPAQCWCMEWRLPREEWNAGRGDGNRRAMQGFIEAGNVPGILAYDGEEPAGWCSIAPRTQHGGLQAVAQYRNFDDASVWLVSCFYISEAARGKGLMSALLEAAVAYAKDNGARVIEGYPVDEKSDAPLGGLYWGKADAFRRLGFVETGRGVANVAVMRLYTQPRPAR